MIGIFDSGYGGLSILRALAACMPQQPFLYLGDHRNAPYGPRSQDEIYDLTTANIRWLFEHDCDLVILACNTASCVLRRIQHEWLPLQDSRKRVLGVVIPLIEAVTGMAWNAPHQSDAIAKITKIVGVFATAATVRSRVFPLEIKKRAPHIEVIQQACPALTPLIEAGAPSEEIKRAVKGYVEALQIQLEGKRPDHILLGCTHYALIEDVFQALLPGIPIVNQPACVAASLEDYLKRHPDYRYEVPQAASALLTTGDQNVVNRNRSNFFTNGSDFKTVHVDGLP